MQLYSAFRNTILWELLFSLRGVYDGDKKNRSSTFCYTAELQLFKKWQWPDAYISGNADSSSMDITVPVSGERRRCGTIALRDSVQHGTVAAQRNNEKTKSCKSMMTLSSRHSECLFSGSQNCDESCMLLSCDAILDGTRRIGTVLFQKWISDFHLPESFGFFVRNSGLKRPHPLPVLLA